MRPCLRPTQVTFIHALKLTPEALTAIVRSATVLPPSAKL